MRYEIKNFDHLIGLEGFSQKTLKTHFNLYKGYVNNTNKLLEALSGMLENNNTSGPEYMELKRRFGWEFNGMRLHEYFFEALSKEAKELNKNSKLFKKISADFGSFDHWLKDFKSCALMRGIGWTILYYDKASNRLLNVWINEHDVGHLGGLNLILNLDVFEHAYIIDYGTNRSDYIDAFLRVVNWESISERFNKAGN
jgi:Fe-Mn family superoxide dismutase